MIFMRCALMNIFGTLLIVSIVHGYQPGDIDGDGKISVADSIASLQVAVGMTPAITAPVVRTIVVSPVPGDETLSGSNLLSALTEASAATFNDQWLIQMEPGVYDLGTASCVVPQWVHLSGSGPNATLIKTSALYGIDVLGSSDISNLKISRSDGTETNGTGIIIRELGAEIKNVHVIVVASNYAIGIWANGVIGELVIQDVELDAIAGAYTDGIYLQSSNANIINVAVKAHRATNNTGILIGTTNGNTPRVNLQLVKIDTWQDTVSNDGVQTGIMVTSAELMLQNSKVSASQGVYSRGIHADNSIVVIDNSEIGVNHSSAYSYGLYNDNSADTKIRHSSVTQLQSTGSGWAIFNTNDGGEIKIDNSEVNDIRNDSQSMVYAGSTKISDGVGNVSGSVTCAGVWSSNYTFYAAVCP